VHPFVARIPPPPAAPCIAQATVTSPWHYTKLQKPRDALNGRSGLTCMHASASMRALLPPCFTLASPWCCLQNSCMCMRECFKPVDAAWVLKGPNTQTVLACSCISIAHLLHYKFNSI